MTPSINDLPGRAVKARGWEWMPRMRVFHVGRPYTVIWVREHEWLDATMTVLEAIDEETMEKAELVVRDETFPDLEDAATKGCMLSRVRRVWGSPTAHPRLSTTFRASDKKPAWEMDALYLSEKAAQEMKASPGSVNCWGFINEEETLIFALENCP